MRTSLIVILAFGSLVASGCSDDPEHPGAAETLERYRPSPVIGEVDGRRIGAEEARVASAELGLESADEVARHLEERELLVGAALQSGADASHARKQAMVRAFLADAIEARVTPETLADEDVAPYEDAAREELSRPGGYRVAAVRVAPMPLLRKDEEIPKERAVELIERAAETAGEIRDWVLEDPSPERFEAFDVETVEDPLRAEVHSELTIADPDATSRPDGWVSAPALWMQIDTIEEGEVTELLQSGPVAMFAMRTERIPPLEPSDDEVRELATERAITDRRAETLDRLLEKLRARTATSKYPQTLKEEHQISE